MATSTTYTVSDPGILEYTFAFEVIDDSHIEVTKNGVSLVNPTDFSVNVDTGTVILTTPPSVADVLLIRRVTPRTDLVVEFVDAARELAQNLNKALKQPLFVIEETESAGGGVLSLNEDGQYDAGNKRIVNLAEPLDAQDAATKDYTDNAIDSAFTFGPDFPAMSEYEGVSEGTQTVEMSLVSGSQSGIPYPLDSKQWQVFLSASGDVTSYVILPPNQFSISTADSGATLLITIDPTFSLPADWFVRATLLGNRRDYVGNATTASEWATPRDLSLTGDATATLEDVDGGSNVSATLTLATIGTITPNVEFSNANVTVDAKGRVIALANGSGATDMEGTDGTDPGVHGLVPEPQAADRYKFLRGDASFQYAPGVNGLQTFTSSGTFAVPAGVSKVKVTVVGGGGAGYTDTYNGARAQAVVSVTPGASISVTVGSAGNTSSFGASIVCPTGGASAPTVSGTDSASASTVCAVPRWKLVQIPASALVVGAPVVALMGVPQEYGDCLRAIRWSSVNGSPQQSEPAAPGIVIVEW